MKCWKKDCKICERELGAWEYVFGITFKEYLSWVNWKSLLAIMFLTGGGYWLWGWAGAIGGWTLSYILGNAEGGAQIYFAKEKVYQTKCIAGKINCTICDNDGSFRGKYEETLLDKIFK